MIVRELITRLGFSTNTAQLNNAETATERLKDRAEQAAGAFRNIVAAVASFATVKAIIGIADEMQNIRTRVGQLPQTVGDAGVAFDEVAARASAAGVKIDAYASLYTKVGNAAKDYIKTQEDLLGITDTISQALVVGGASAQEASAVMTQFSQALASGVLQGDEFRSMAEAAPQYLDKLAETMKIPREQLKKMASDGKLTAKAVIEATRQMSDYFGEKFKEMPMTVGRAMTVVGNRFSMMLDRMNRESNFVTKIANLILAGFDKIEAGVDKLVKAFGGWNNMLRFVGIAIGVALGAKALAILSAFRAASLLAMLPFIKIIAIITAVALVLEDLYVWIQGGESLTGSLIGPWEEWAPYVMAVINMVRDAVVWFGEAIGAVAAMIVGMLTLDGDLFMAGLEGLTGMLWSVIQQWWAYLVESFKAAWSAVSQFFVDAMTALGKMIYDAIFAPIVNAVKDAWNSGKGAISGAWEGAKSFVGVGGGAGAGTGGAMGAVPTVAPAQLSPAAMGAGRPSVQSNTNVTVTVPPGTTAEQAKFLQGAAQQSFGKGANDKLARDLAVYAP
jgi:tape measure domain-containing protein